jgi:cysteinyl-tRNA synthetase
MPLMVFNTLSQRKEPFIPLSGNRVGIYVCGPTVYDFSHIGHARTFISFDVIVKYLRRKGFDVLHVVNITNVDDKIIRRANETKRDPMELADEFERIFYEDMDSLKVSRADINPRVSDHITEIITVIQSLISKGFAYEVDGDVYFDVRKADGYGRLSGQTLEEIKAGARVEVDERKRYPADFALWKKAKPGEPFWESPWGRGRPGWHIECTAMSMKYIGPQVDIHGGARDLIFPHHENEIAQSEAVTGKKPFVKYWMHAGFLMVEGEKMAKSLGNFIVIRDLLKDYDPETFRLFVLSTHYRSQIDFSYSSLRQAESALGRLHASLARVEELIASQPVLEPTSDEEVFDAEVEAARNAFMEAMDDDFNTPIAISHLFNLVREVNRFIADHPKVSYGTLKKIRDAFLDMGGMLGILKEHRIREEPLPREVSSLLEERQRLRELRDWEKADEIRAKILSLGYVLEDTSEGVKVRKVVKR